MKEFSFPKDAKKAILKVKGKIYAVGGAVRDSFFGIESKDLDVIVTGIPYPDLCRILSGYGKVDLVGKSFGIIKWLPNGIDEVIDVALPRTEVSTGKGHQDFEVNFDHTLDIKDDLARRDFTINAIAVNLNNGYVIDPFNGEKHIKSRILSEVSKSSFKDDPLRMMRGIQFIARFGLDLPAQTVDQYKNNAYLIKHVSKERIAIELEKLFSKGKQIDYALKMMDLLGLWKYIFPEFEPRFFDFDGSQLDISSMFAMIFAYADTNATSSRELLAKETIEEFKLSIAGVNKDKVARLIKNSKPLTKDINDIDLRHYISKEMNGEVQNFYDQVGVWASMSLISSPLCFKFCTMAAEIERRRDPLKISHLMINGSDLIQLGMAGKEIGDALQKCLNMVLNEPYNNDYATLIGYAK